MGVIADLVWSVLASTPSSPTTNLVIPVATGDGALWDVGGYPKKCLLTPPGVIPLKSNSEAVIVLSRSGDNLTVQARDYKNWNSNTGRSIAAGWVIMNTPFADDFFNTSIINNEVPGGLVNSANVNYTVASPYMTGSLRVFKNGVRMKGGAGNDYVEVAGGFTMATAPASGAVLLVDYMVGDTQYSVGSNSLVTDEAVGSGAINGSNAAFTTVRPYIPGTLEVYVNGLRQVRGTHLTETTPSTGAFTLDVAPLATDNVRVNYQYNLNPASNSDTVDGQHAYQLAPVGIFQPYAGRFAPSGWLNCDGSAVSRSTYPDLFNAMIPLVGQPTVSIATPAVFTLLAHGLLSGDTVYFTTSGALPTGISANTLYYVVSATTNTFQISATRGGTAIASSGSQSGTHNVYYCPYGLGNGTSTFNVPDMRGRAPFGADAQGGTAAGRMNLATTQGIAGNQGASGGEQSHVQTQSELVAHTHQKAAQFGSNGEAFSETQAWGRVNGYVGGGPLNTELTGGGAAANITPPGLIANYIIKAF